MARVFKQTYTKPVPEGAETFTREGKRHARYKSGKGKTVTAPLSEDGSQIILEATKWYVEYRDADGYGHHFGCYDGREHGILGCHYYAFRVD